MLLAILAMLPLVAAADAQAPAKPHIVFMLADGEPPAYLRPVSAALLPRLLPRLLQCLLLRLSLPPICRSSHHQSAAPARSQWLLCHRYEAIETRVFVCQGR